jgi:hypothetical protein
VAAVFIVASVAPAVADPAAIAADSMAAAEQMANEGVAAPAQPQQPTIIKLPALTLIEIRILDEVSSKTAFSGQEIQLELAEPLYVTAELGIPAGTTVEGLVIHADRGGMGGKSGELLLGAKRIRLSADVAIPLRSFKLGPARGRSNETLAFAAAATVGLPSLFIKGGSARIPAGTVANAKTSLDTEIPVALLSKLPLMAASANQPAPSAPAPTTQDNPTQGE